MSEHHIGCPDNSPLKVLLWSPKGSGLHYGGPGMAAYRVYSKSDAGAFRLTLVHGYAQQINYPVFSSVFFLGEAGPGSLQMMRFIGRGKKWIAAHAKDFDVFHGLQGFHPTMVPAITARRNGLPAVVKLAAYKSDLSDKPGLRHSFLKSASTRRRWAASLDAVVATSSDIAEELLSYGVPESRIARIPNGVDTDQFFPPLSQDDVQKSRLALGWPERPTLLFVGGINQRKRPHLLIDVIAQAAVSGSGPAADCQVVLIGPADEPRYLESIRIRAKQLGVSERVIIEPFRADINLAYQAADAFALLSRSEGMPNALLEAMASGLPSIVTAFSGARDIISDGVNGRIVSISEQDSSSIGGEGVAMASEALVEALSKEGRAMGSRAAVDVRDRFSAYVVARMYEKLFRSIISGNR